MKIVKAEKTSIEDPIGILLAEEFKFSQSIGRYEMDYMMSRIAGRLKDAYISYVKILVPTVEYVKAKEIACQRFKEIEYEDFAGK